MYAFVNRFSPFDRTHLLETRLLRDHDGPQAVALQGRATYLHIGAFVITTYLFVQTMSFRMLSVLASNT